MIKGMTNKAPQVAFVLLALGCGGRAENQASAGGSSSSGASSGVIVGGLPTTGGLGGSGDLAGTNTGGQAGGAGAETETAGTTSVGAAGAAGATPSFVPETPAPFDQAYLEDGSFEAYNGNGWDTCDTSTPGVLTRTHGNASQGGRAFEFSSGACPGCYRTNAPSTSQVYLWFTQTPPSAMGLYFDVLNLSNTTPLGELRLEATDLVCDPVRPLATITLSDLVLEHSWQTRCIDLPAFGPNEALGIAVAGASYDVALDALRFGPPCHVPRGLR